MNAEGGKGMWEKRMDVQLMNWPRFDATLSELVIAISVTKYI